ncbi:MAG: Spx/MgsR family RNA polymerase-binding regulatory protein [Myxococcales bacterium]|jgi:arsenate reductase
MLTFYGYDKCDTCRRARRALESWGVEVERIDITRTPPPKQVLERALDSGGYALKELFNRSGQEYRKLGIKDRLPEMSRAEALKLLAGNGRLVKRPIVTDGERVTVGHDAARFEATWKV